MNCKNVFVSSCCKEGGIHRFTLENGLLCEDGFFPCDSPMYTVYDSKRLYVLLRSPFGQNSHSGVFSWELNEKGMPENPGSIISTEGIVGCHLCTDGDEIYAANYISGSVTKLGKSLVVHEGKSVHPSRQEKAHTHFVCVSPDRKYILAVDLGMDAILVYDKDLKEVSRVYAPAGSGPRHLVFSSDGKLCYCSDELSSTVSVYRYTDGKLAYLESYSSLPGNFRGKSTLAAIREQDGYVYTSNRGHDSIAVFKIAGERLELVNIFSCQGNSPRDFDITENTLISTNEVDGSVTVFDITNKSNPLLTQKINVKNALCVTIV